MVRTYHESPEGQARRKEGRVKCFGAIYEIATGRVRFLDQSHHLQEFNRANARMQAGLLFLATTALVIPSAIATSDFVAGGNFSHQLSVGLSILLIITYGLGMLFTLKTHREVFASAAHEDHDEAPWPIGLALATLAGVTVLVALVCETFVESVQMAAETFGMSPAFVGFIVVALVGAAAEMASAFSGARKNRLDMSVGIALGSASQIALFVAPVLVLLSYVLGPTPMDLQFWPGAVVMIFIATLTAALVTANGRTAWFIGVLLLIVYLIFAMTLYLLPPQANESIRNRIVPARQAGLFTFLFPKLQCRLMTPPVFTCCLLISAIAVADPAQNAAIKDVMKEKGVAFIIIDCASGEITDIDPGASGKRLPPCSTFKIWNSLIAIEEGLQTGAEEPFYQWDGAASKSIIGPASQTIDENPGYSQRHTLRQDR